MGKSKNNKCEIPEGLLEEHIIGIDLGTTNTCAAIWRNGNVEVIPTKTGKRTLPSVVAFTRCQRHVGDDAKNQKELNPQNVFFEVKRLIGRKMDDPVVQNELEYFPYKLVGDQFQNINLIPDLGNDKIYTPEEISAVILSEVKQMTFAYMGEKITKCIITVPAHFNDGQRQATKDAAEIAGLECIRIINEPISAALAYGLYQRSQYEYKKKIEEIESKRMQEQSNFVSKECTNKNENLDDLVDSDNSDSDNDSVNSDTNSTKSDESTESSKSTNSVHSSVCSDDETHKHVLVYDFGGGTLDVCLLRIQNGIFTVLANSGNTRMGGSDFDTRLMSFCISVFKKQYGYKEIKELPALSLQKLRSSCESTKKLLSTVMKSRIAIKNFYNGKDLILTITRPEFEKMCEDLFLAILRPVNDTLNQVDMNASEIDDIITVGGMTRMPKIRELLKQKFGKEPNCTINPDEAVACGAAIQGYLLSHKDDPFSDTVTLLDSTSLSLGVEADGGVLSVIIPRGEIIPVSQSKEYSTDSDYVSSVIIKVYEGERTIATEKGNFFVGEFELCGIEPAPRGVPEIEVTFSIDSSGIIVVTAQNKKTFDSSSLTVTSNKGRLTRDQIDALIEEARDYEIRDELEKRKKLMYYEIDDFCSNILYNIDKKEIKLTEKDRDIIIKDVDKVMEWLKSKPSEERDEEEYLKVIKSLKEQYGVLVVHGHVETNKLLKDSEEVGNKNGVTVYGNEDEDDNEDINKIFEKIDDEEKGYKGMSDPEKAEFKELRQAVFDLCNSVLDIVDSGNLQIAPEHIKDMKEYIDDTLMWVHIHEKPTRAEYKLKIDNVNNMCDKIFKFYEDSGTQLFKENEIVQSIQNPRDELENLCIIIKLLIQEQSIPLDKKDLAKLYKLVNDTSNWIFEYDISIEKLRVDKKDEDFINNAIKTFHDECITKLTEVNNESDIVNQKINGINLEKFKSTIDSTEEIILTGYNNIEPNENYGRDGTSIIDIMKKKQKNIMADMISDTVDNIVADNITDITDDTDEEVEDVITIN